MADAGADVIGAHVGLTEGGFMEERTFRRSTTRATASRPWPRRPGAHDRTSGWSLTAVSTNPTTVQAAYDRLDVDGFLAASSVERLPVEKAIVDTVASFRRLKLRRT